MARLLFYSDPKFYPRACVFCKSFEALKEGIAILREALEVDPRCKKPNIHLGLYLFQRDQLNQALVQFQKALEIDPYNVKVHNHLAVIYQSRGDMIGPFQPAGKS